MLNPFSNEQYTLTQIVNQDHTKGAICISTLGEIRLTPHEAKLLGRALIACANNDEKDALGILADWEKACGRI